MILEALGVLENHAITFTTGSAKATNVLNLGALGIYGFGPGGNRIFLDIETVTIAGNATATYQIDVVVSNSETLSSNRKPVLSTGVITGSTDTRIAAALRKIFTGEICDQIWSVMQANAGYVYCGLWVTIGAGSGTTPTLTFNAAISPSRPRTKDDVQVTDSPVNLPS